MGRLAVRVLGPGDGCLYCVDIYRKAKVHHAQRLVSSGCVGSGERRGKGRRGWRWTVSQVAVCALAWGLTSGGCGANLGMVAPVDQQNRDTCGDAPLAPSPPIAALGTLNDPHALCGSRYISTLPIVDGGT